MLPLLGAWLLAMSSLLGSSSPGPTATITAAPTLEDCVVAVGTAVLNLLAASDARAPRSVYGTWRLCEGKVARRPPSGKL